MIGTVESCVCNYPHVLASSSKNVYNGVTVVVRSGNNRYFSSDLEVYILLSDKIGEKIQFEPINSFQFIVGGSMTERKFEIVRNIAVLSESKSGWKCEINLVKWGDNAPVYDIRDWSPDHTKMGKGKTLEKEEIEKLYRALKVELCRKESASQSNVFGSSSDCQS